MHYILLSIKPGKLINMVLGPNFFSVEVYDPYKVYCAYNGTHAYVTLIKYTIQTLWIVYMKGYTLVKRSFVFVVCASMCMCLFVCVCACTCVSVCMCIA